MKFIVIFAGARDEYQLPLAFLKTNRLKYLVTDDIILRRKYRNMFPRKVLKVPLYALILQVLIKVFPKTEHKLRNRKDIYISKFAGNLSKREKCPVISYSGYASYVFPNTNVSPKILFQYHPHALSNLKIYEREIAVHPQLSWGYKQEVEFQMTEDKKKCVLGEIREADYYIGASSFTVDTLVENGADPNKVAVCPYGVSVLNYPYKKRNIPEDGCVTFAFVGSYTFRKGIFYLVEAAKILQSEGLKFRIEMTGRQNASNMKYLEESGVDNLIVHYNLSSSEMKEMLYRSHVFLFPSLVEGFAFSIVEAMSTGMPIISTDHTIARDVVTTDSGFVIPISDVEALAAAMRFFIINPNEINKMGKIASEIAARLKWDDFHKKINDFIDIVESTNNP
jgi:glycosyltransferase involved in cell wall biosynthesis